MAKETTEEKMAKLEDNQNKLLESLAAEKKLREKAEKSLEVKEVAEKKVADPMSGPGNVCEVTNITRSESWQVPSIEVVNPKTMTVETKPNMAMVPEGYKVRYDSTNSVFIVKEGHEDMQKYTLEEVVIPNCQSRYTKELTVFTKKSVLDRGDFSKEPPRVTVHLCEKHQKMFGAITPVEVKKRKGLNENAKREQAKEVNKTLESA